MKNILKTAFLSVFFLAFNSVSTITAQNTTIPGSFTIVGENDSKQSAFYTKSILNASMEQYRLLDTDVTLSFKEGFNCILFSAKKVSITQPQIDLTQYVESFHPNYLLPVFSIANNGHILGEVKPFGKLGK